MFVDVQECFAFCTCRNLPAAAGSRTYDLMLGRAIPQSPRLHCRCTMRQVTPGSIVAESSESKRNFCVLHAKSMKIMRHIVVEDSVLTLTTWGLTCTEIQVHGCSCLYLPCKCGHRD
uniref:Uncharacterized protein n=1 Tax=Rhipicephalus zambeziensis TaxID=60191 RepID=A0A224YG00_9ACAR